MFELLLLLWSVDQIIIIGCISCGESFRKRGRPQKTAEVDGFLVGCNGGRPHNTTRESGSFVSDGCPHDTPGKQAMLPVMVDNMVPPKKQPFLLVMVNQLERLVAI